MADDALSTADVITASLNEQFGNDWNTDDGGDDDIQVVETSTGGDDDGDTDTADAGDGGDADTAAGDGGDSDTVGVETGEDTTEVKDKTPVVDEGDDTDKELEALGIKRPKAGERENRLPYTRMKKIFTNAKKKWDEGVQTTIKAHTDKITNYEGQLARYNATNEMIQKDPDRFMAVLAHLNPTYKKYIEGGGAAKTTEVVTDANDPMPEPDFTYQDGSKGFTPEGFAKREAWLRRQSVREAVQAARKEWEKDFGPIKQEREDRRLAQEAHEKRQASVNNQIARARKVWGDETLKTHKDAILAKLNEDPSLEFGDAIAAVVYPLLSKNRDTIHADVVAELKKRPAAVTKGGQGTLRTSKKDISEMTTEEVILETLREQGLVK